MANPVLEENLERLIRRAAPHRSETEVEAAWSRFAARLRSGSSLTGRPVPPPAGFPATAPATSNTQAGQEPEGAPRNPPPQEQPKTTVEWGELLKKRKDSDQITEQQKALQAAEHYHSAERYLQQGDFERTVLECKTALKLNPNHAAARTLWLETQFILGPGKATFQSEECDELALKREITRKIAQLLDLCYMAFDQKRFDRCIRLCDEILLIDPHYVVARELREDAEKTRHKEEYYNALAKKVEEWKKLTKDDERAVIPWIQTVRFPSRPEWALISKRITESVTKQDPTVMSEREKEAEKLFNDGQTFEIGSQKKDALKAYQKLLSEYADTDFVKKWHTPLENLIKKLK
jgi:tetratricopeptide (TPR) repeat protein